MDLSTKEMVEEELGPDLMRRWLGGRGLNIEVLYREAKAGLDPFNPENPISFSVGPLCGTLAPGSGMVSVASRSPLLSPPSLGSTTMGGHFGAELKYAGYDQLIIKGRAKRPLYLWIDDDRIELRDASHLWGRDTLETTLLIQEELRDRAIQVACIGRAGERSVRFASIMSLFWEGERLGLGAVMGAKNLKAIAVRGSKPVGIREPEGFIQVSQRVREKIVKDLLSQRMSAEGTLFLLHEANRGGLGAFKNHSGYAPGMEDEFKGIKRYFSVKESCFSCPIGCSRHIHIGEGPFSGLHFGGLSVERVCSLGPRIGSYRWDHVLRLIWMCGLAGLDAVSTGGVISWAMDCFERGRLSKEETGFPLRWGDVEAAGRAIELIQGREGFWATLGEGVRRAAEMVGRDTEERASQVKGVELPSLDPRIATGAALSFAVSTSDWDYLKSMGCLEFPLLAEGYPEILEEVLGKPSIEIDMTALDHKPRLVKFAEERKCVADLLGICSALVARLYPLGISDLAELLEEATGMELDGEELLRAAERVINLERAYHARDGFGSREDTYPERFFTEEVGGGPYRGVKLERRGWERALSEYYKCRGWEEGTGIPSRDILKKIGLEGIIGDIERAGEDYKRKGKVQSQEVQSPR